MSVRTLTDTSVEKPKVNCRCYNLIVDGSVTLPDGELITSGNVDLQMRYTPDTYLEDMLDCNYTICGNMVTLQLKTLIHTIVVTGGLYEILGLPVGLRPTVEQNCAIIGESAGANTTCLLKISTAGAVTIYRTLTAADFSSTGVSGIPFGQVITYSL